MQTNVGLNARRDLIGAAITHIAVGDDDTAPSVVDPTLGNEVDRQALESVIDGATGVVTVRARFGNALVGALVEVGSFDAGVGGNMFDRVVHAVVNKVVGVEMLVDITYTVS